MTRQGLRDALDELELTQVEFARAIGFTPRTVRRWIAGGEVVPQWLAVLVDLLLTYPDTQDAFKRRAIPSRSGISYTPSPARRD